MDSKYQEYLFPLALICLAFVFFSLFKHTENLTFIDAKYLEKLAVCQPYTASGKVVSLGNTSSISKIIGVKNGKCEIETVNTYAGGKTLASMCKLNKEQLTGMYNARASHTFIFYGFDDGIYVDKMKKEGACKSYKLVDKKWVEKK